MHVPDWRKSSPASLKASSRLPREDGACWDALLTFLLPLSFLAGHPTSPAQLHYCQITKFCHLVKLYSAGSLYHYTSWTEHSANSQFPLAGGKTDFLGQVLCFCSPAGLQSCWGLSTEPWMQKAAMHWPAQCPEPNHHFSQDLTRTCPWPCFSSRPQHMSHLGSVAPAWKCSPKGSSGLEAPENQTGGTEKSLPRCSPPVQGLMP